jgi:S1-C subfamily serine protease
MGLSLAAGCSGAAPTPETPQGKDIAPPKPAATSLLDKPKAAAPTAIAAVIPSRELLDFIRRAPLAANTERASAKGGAASLPENGKGDVRENYRAVAPATVIIRTPEGLGTGVLIGPSGWILTNNHVIAGGEHEDFRIKVSVEMGTLDKSGAMERSNKLITAYVHKADPVRDLAIVKLDGNYKDLPYVRVAKNDPAPGEPVASLGHAGSGLVWAIKDGEVAAVGKLSTHLASLVGLECSPSEDSEGCKRKHDAMEGLKKMLDHDKPLMVVQSTCPNWPGDSGGPLVNRANELVGLNSFGYGNSENRATYHVHVEEIRAFLQEIPTNPIDVLPDPWFDGGAEATLEDGDLDGNYDVLRTDGRNGFARFYDLDQDSPADKSGTPDVADIVAKRAFDAEVAFLATSSNSYVWYDTDNDGKYDVMLFDEGSTGHVSRGYRIGSNGRLKADDSLGSGGAYFQPSLMANGAAGQMLARLGAVTLGVSAVDARGPLEQGLPDPLLGGGRKVELHDFDRDGRSDTLETSSVYSHGYVMDVDQSSIGEINKDEDAQKLLEQKKVDAEVSVITQGSDLWVWYDRDNDGKFDFVTHTGKKGAGAALEAFRVDPATGRKEPAPEAIGRKMLRPHLLDPAGLAARASRMAFGALPTAAAAISDDGLDSFPDPLMHGGLYQMYADTSEWSKGFGSKAGWDKAIIVSAGMTESAIVVDINRDTGAVGKMSAADLAESGKFKPDFAFLHRSGAEWTYYDTDGDNKYDMVLFTSSPVSGAAERGYRIDAKTGAVQLDPSLEGGKMVRWSVFGKKPVASQMKKLASELFQSRAIEP